MPELTRPNSEALLKNIQCTEPEFTGKLKIFFGYAAGVGKTYAMLEAAHRAKDAGVDVVAGYIEPHTRPETAALLEGLEQLPPKVVSYKGMDLQEFDLDGALRRRPRLILVDELAHTNAPGCRHAKRYQDVQELLRFGIDVYTTVNVQHLESLNDVVASITGVTVTERIPDSVFDSADQVEVMDLEPADLLDRLRAGKIYQEAQASQATEHFFTGKNLAALREIALRRTADRLERGAGAGDGTKARTGEHILICLSGAPSNAKVIRTAARMAEAFHGFFTALFVEPAASSQSEEERGQLLANLRLAEELGARIATVYGDDPAIQIAAYARVSGISKIVLGRSPRQRGFLLSSKNLVDRLNELAPDLDIYIIPDQSVPNSRRKLASRPVQERFSWTDSLRMFSLLALCTAVGYLFRGLGFKNDNIIMVYILGVLGVSMVTTGRSYSLLSSVLSVLIFNFFFTHPYFTLMSDPSYLATFGIMFIVALLGSSLTTRIKRQATQSANKAYRTEVLLETSRKLQKSEGTAAILAVTAAQLGKLLERDLLLYPVGEDGELAEAMCFPAVFGTNMDGYLTPEERAVADWVRKNSKHAGATTGTLPSSKCLYLAVRGAEQVLAVAGIVIAPARKPDAFEKNLMVAILDECGLALEKERMIRAKQRVEETAQQEALRANLLRAISHDLRTPLTSISGNAGILMENGKVLDEAKRQALYVSIYDDSMWLISLVENLLSITRMEHGAMKLNIQPELLDEVFTEALSHLDRNAGKHHISVDLKDDLLMADMDAQLIVQVVINIVNNAIKYTPEGSSILVSAKKAGRFVQVAIADNGPGIPKEAREKLFDMFYTVNNARGDGRRGLGLGLSLCRSIVAAHGGSISALDNPPHGTIFLFTLRASEVTPYE
ncbi:two-component system, OmpR family, sensor histidine kinase KdpD [Oscillibacter sp. PC13]|uniref:sensor histidine kinase n=1 Tax=Oscillibacter sp. PC13 TaxID=1855299 RepID=UPI0008E732F5|nr:sensor histidine kinase KdpD [Oscillibacter sp. PC13]SFP83760.1 two-component system, OmpR family, sensor histidine kinase KdpD [Oscillibacter sp. PC13]